MIGGGKYIMGESNFLKKFKKLKVSIERYVEASIQHKKLGASLTTEFKKLLEENYKEELETLTDIEKAELSGMISFLKKLMGRDGEGLLDNSIHFNDFKFN